MGAGLTKEKKQLDQCLQENIEHLASLGLTNKQKQLLTKLKSCKSELLSSVEPKYNSILQKYLSGSTDRVAASFESCVRSYLNKQVGGMDIHHPYIVLAENDKPVKIHIIIQSDASYHFVDDATKQYITLNASEKDVLFNPSQNNDLVEVSMFMYNVDENKYSEISLFLPNNNFRNILQRLKESNLVKEGGRGKTITIEKTQKMHTDRKGVKRVVYAKGSKKYIKRKINGKMKLVQVKM